MPKKKVAVSINLLASKSFESSQVGKVLNWALNAGKIILFSTFLIVISALIYRFSLDKKIETLNDQITTNTHTIQQLGNVETKIRKFQSKLDSIDSLTQKQQSLSAAISLLEKNLPSSVSLETLTINNKQMEMKGTIPNETVFSNMLTAFKLQAEFSEIVIDELHSGGLENPTISFTVRLSFDETKTQL